MTPTWRAKALHVAWWELTRENASVGDERRLIERHIRAAIAERDRQWLEAVKDQLLDCEACGHMFSVPGSRSAVGGIPGACTGCAPLRTLLQEAGS